MNAAVWSSEGLGPFAPLDITRLSDWAYWASGHLPLLIVVAEHLGVRHPLFEVRLALVILRSDHHPKVRRSRPVGVIDTTKKSFTSLTDLRVS